MVIVGAVGVEIEVEDLGQTANVNHSLMGGHGVLTCRSHWTRKRLDQLWITNETCGNFRAISEECTPAPSTAVPPCRGMGRECGYQRNEGFELQHSYSHA